MTDISSLGRRRPADPVDRKLSSISVKANSLARPRTLVEVILTSMTDASDRFERSIDDTGGNKVVGVAVVVVVVVVDDDGRANGADDDVAVLVAVAPVGACGKMDDPHGGPLVEFEEGRPPLPIPPLPPPGPPIPIGAAKGLTFTPPPELEANGLPTPIPPIPPVAGLPPDAPILC